MYKRSPQKEQAQKLRILNSLTHQFQPATEVSKKANLLISRGKELLNILENEGKVEKTLSKTQSYSYWKLRNTELESKGESLEGLNASNL
jgi:predicted transcriptional regulator